MVSCVMGSVITPLTGVMTSGLNIAKTRGCLWMTHYSVQIKPFGERLDVTLLMRMEYYIQARDAQEVASNIAVIPKA